MNTEGGDGRRSRTVLVALLAGCAACGPPRAPKVLVIGLDGVRVDRLAEADTPHLDSLARNGILLPAEAVSPTVSGPNWSSILTGVVPEKHGVLSNDFSENRYERYPDFLTRLELVDARYHTAALVSWPPLASGAAGGPLVSDRVDRRIVMNGDSLGYGPADSMVAAAAAALLRSAGYDALFVYLGNIDEVGHQAGALAPEYRAAIEAADREVGWMLAALARRPAAEDWLVLVTTDHGRRDDGGHGGDTDQERSSFILVSGRSARGDRPSHPPRVYDVAATALGHLRGALDSAWQLDGRPVLVTGSP